MKYSEEEKNKINETIHKIADDINRVFAESGYEEIRIKAFGKYPYLGFRPSLFINENEIYLKKGGGKYYFKKHGLLTDATKGIHFDNDAVFIKNYEANKKAIEKIADRGKKKKMSFLEGIDETKKNLESSVEVTLPESQNRHEIEITNENGRNVGIIDFGGQIVKIITDNDIVVVNRQKEEKIMRK